MFCRYPDFAATHLSALLNAGIEVVAVYTQPDRPKDRGHKLQPSPVKEIALEHNIPVFQPESFKKDPDAITQYKKLDFDLLVVVAYGLILPDEVIYTPKYGAINVHGSLLPRWRGAAPIQRSLYEGDKETGVTIMKICPELDAGDMLAKSVINIENNDTSLSLYEKLADAGSKQLVEVVNNIEFYLNKAEPQNPNLVTYAAKLNKAEAKMDWKLPATTIERYIRTYIPWPNAYFAYNEQNIKVFEAQVVEYNNSSVIPGTVLEVSKNGVLIATSENAILLKKIQIPGKKALNFQDIYNSRKDMFKVGDILE